MKAGSYLVCDPLDLRKVDELTSMYYREPAKKLDFKTDTFFEIDRHAKQHKLSQLKEIFTESYKAPEVFLAELNKSIVGPKPIGRSRYWPMMFKHKDTYNFVWNLINEGAKNLLEQQRILEKVGEGFAYYLKESDIKISGRCVWLFTFNNFDHFIRETLPTLILLKKSPIAFSELKFIAPNISDSSLEILKLFGIQDHQLIQIPNAQIEVEKLIVSCFTTFGHVHTPTHMYIDTCDFLREQVKVKKNFGYQPPEKIYVSRKRAKQRKLAHEFLLEQKFKEKGFSVIDPGVLSQLEQVYYFSNAKIVVGPHGMGITNLSFSKSPSLLVEIMPVDWNRVSYFRTAQLKEARYGCYWVSRKTPESDYTVDIDQFLSFFESCLNSAGLPN